MDEGKAEIKTLDARRKELQTLLETADEPPALLHPEMGELYREKVTTLAEPWSAQKATRKSRRLCEGSSTPSC